MSGRVVVLGGGMGALTTAFELTEGDWRARLDSVVVYQRGGRLGGKGASSRGPHGRIEEHGLHVLLGHYDATIDLLERCYEELDRPRTDPGCPIATWADAVSPAPAVGLADRTDGGWLPWTTRIPGRTRHAPASGPTPVDVVVRGLELLADFHRSGGAPPTPGVRLSSRADPPPAAFGADTATALRAAALTGAAVAVSLLHHTVGTLAGPEDGAAGPGGGTPGDAPFVEGPLLAVLDAVRSGAEATVVRDAGLRRTAELVDLVVTNVSGVLADGLLDDPDGFRRIDHFDYRDWLRGHGAREATLGSALVRGMYDLVFAYEDGDPERPRFSAGLGIELATRMLFGHGGPIFWRMQAGMGEIVFAPLYEVLRRRGVEFRFFHRVDALRLDGGGRRVQRIEMGRQVDLADGRDEYEPLVRVGGLPCWASEPVAEQLSPEDRRRVEGCDLESFWTRWDDAGAVVLEAGRDFDVVVFGISLGMVPHVAADLVARSPAWRAMVDDVGLVATQSFQAWLDQGESDLGWAGPPATTLSGFVEPFDTWASMGHLLPFEQWPAGEAPAAIAYFCNALPGGVGIDPDRAAAARSAVRDRAVAFLDRHVGALWPGAVDAGGFRWSVLHDPEGRSGPARFDAQYWRANVDPSDLYVQSLPGSGRSRLAPDGSGFANLVLAGDWTACGLDAGCLEAATLSGLLAAEAVERIAGVGGEAGDGREAGVGRQESRP